MSLRTRILRVRTRLASIAPDNRVWSITLIPVGEDPEGRVPGFYYSSLHLDIVYEGLESPQVPRERMASHCLVIECGPRHVPPPEVEAGEAEIARKSDTLLPVIAKGSL